MTVANDIYQQLGGGRFKMFTGATVIASGNSLRIKLKRGSTKNKAQWCIITLNGFDLYDVEFVNFNRNLDRILISEHNDVYCDMLVQIFEDETGLYTKF